MTKKPSINHRRLKIDGYQMTGSAAEHFKGDGSTQPDVINVAGRYYSVNFKKNKEYKDNTNKIVYWEYVPDTKDPRGSKITPKYQ